MFRRTLAVILATSAASVSQIALSQNVCKESDTLQACWNRYHPEEGPLAPEVTQPERADAGNETLDELKGLETGLTGGAGPLATTTRDLLPLLTLTGLLTDSDGNDADNLFTIDLNSFLGRAKKGEDKDNNTQLKAVLNQEPKLFAPLAEAFAALGEERIQELEDGLDASDDVAVSLTYSPVNDKIGRGFKYYRKDFSALLEAAVTKASGMREPADIGALSNAVAVLGRNSAPELTESSVLSDKETREAFENLARSEAKLEQLVRDVYAQYRLKDFALLVGNQPQVNLTAELRERDSRVGPSELAIKVGYEHGFANLNHFRKESGSKCMDFATMQFAAAAAAPCLDAYLQYVESNATPIENADRITAELAYVEVDDYAFTSVDDGVSIARDGSTRLDVSLGFGRTLQVLGPGQDSRLDLVAKYEDYSDDPDRHDRMVATLTLTTQIKGVSVPLAIVYANHGEFLPDVDEELSAHIGIKFSLDSKGED